MSDQSGTGPLPELTPEQDSQVRRLLAEARHLEPIPADVGARLDRALSDLSLEETGPHDTPHDTEPTAPVVDLAARRRRRNAAALLAGAAAVIVAGFGIGQVIDVGSTDSADTAGSAADSNSNRESVTGGDQAHDDAGGGSDFQADSQPAPEAAATELPLRLSSNDLKREVEGQLTRLRSYAAAPQGGPMSLAHLEEAYDCVPSPTTAYGTGELYPALFDGSPTILALRPPTGGHQVVEVLQCGSGAALAMVTVDAP